MGEEQKKALCAQLGVTDQSLGFLLLIIASVLLSLFSVVLQRRGLCLTIQGDTEGAAALPEVYPMKKTAGALVVGSLGFFLCLALDAWEQAKTGGDCVARRSAATNLWASLFVLAAALLRFGDLEFNRRCAGGRDAGQGGETQAEEAESTLPA